MLSVTLGKTTIHFEHLIAVLAIIAAFLLAYVVWVLLLNKRFNRIKNLFIQGDYDTVIIKGEQLLSIYAKNNAKVSTKAILNRIEYLNYVLAVSYFSSSKNELFLAHINSLTKYGDIKNFWLALFYLRQNEADAFERYYNSIADTEETRINKAFLDSVKKNMQGEYEAAKHEMKSILEEIHIPVLMQVADSIVN